jgi:hypothetical protein
MGTQLFRTYGQTTDGHDEANSRFSQFCESAYELVPVLIAVPRIGRLSLTVNITGTEYILFTYLFRLIECVNIYNTTLKSRIIKLTNWKISTQKTFVT